MEEIERLIEICAKQKITLSFAESCTGGLVSATMTEKSGVSKIFLGGVVAYSNLIKTNTLGVPEDLISSYGAVSEQVALAMAKGIQKLSGSDWAVSTTGIAGPDGGSPEKPVGTVCFGIVGKDISFSIRKQFSGDRKSIQQASVNFVWKSLLEQLGKEFN